MVSIAWHSAVTRRPLFRIVCLFVEEEVSVQRQLHRGEQVRAHNRIMREAGMLKDVKPLRDTDASEEKARLRYRVFKTQVYDALKV